MVYKGGELMDTLGYKLLSYRVKNNLTREVVADEIGIDIKTLDNLEKCRKKPNINTRYKVGEYLRTKGVE
jgi:DNA-binding XRE family transcriptional regulator